MRWATRILTAGIGLACLAASDSAGSCPPVTVPLEPAIGVTSWPTSTFRWRDIATNLYAQSYQDQYQYADAQVSVTYEPCGNRTLRGHLEAANLKPNFAYQVKLVGKPSGLWGGEGDDLANEMIGYTGRWWRYQPNTGNSSDAEYELYHDDPAYIFEGYLVFDFFVTDSLGTAEVDFAIDSSYHVLWWAHQRTPQSCDGPIRWSAVIGHADDPAYDQEVGPTEVGVYAEIERFCTGIAELPLGNYRCRFLLTEESFHQSGLGDGYWQSALANDTLEFEIVDLTFVESPTGAIRVGIGPMAPNPFSGRTGLKVRLPGPLTVRCEVYDLSGRLIRNLPAPASGGDEVRFEWDGTDRAGRPAPAGVYLYRLEIPGGADRTGRVVLAR